mmetsp:Transcript_14408/g.38161  ORF Transcript_14408/g.38161 Transcript_14408/m.38161 type:complete len:205 (-) Transcript_14408:315-929(-)
MSDPSASKFRASCFSANLAASFVPNSRRSSRRSFTTGDSARSCLNTDADVRDGATDDKSTLSSFLSRNATNFRAFSMAALSSSSAGGCNFARNVVTRGLAKGGRGIVNVARAPASIDFTSSSNRNSRNTSPSSPKKKASASLAASSSCGTIDLSRIGASASRTRPVLLSVRTMSTSLSASFFTAANRSKAPNISITRSTSNLSD